MNARSLLKKSAVGTAAIAMLFTTYLVAQNGPGQGRGGAGAPGGAPGADAAGPGGAGGGAGRGGPGGGFGGGGGGRGGMTPFDFNDTEGYTQIFDGQTMNGWDYPPTVFRAYDGMIEAGYDPNMSTGTTFATYMGSEPADFDFMIEIKGSGNTGVQFRSFQNNITTPEDGPSREQLRAMGRIDGGSLVEMDAVAEAQKALSEATYSIPANARAISTAADNLASAVLAISLKRADGFAALQASANRLSAAQIATFRNQVTASAPIVGNAIWNVAGYQADFPLVGNIWEGGRFGVEYNGNRINERGNLTTGGNITLADPAPDGRNHQIIQSLYTSEEVSGFYKADDWNQYRILARGNTMALFLNGHMISMTIDQNPVMRREKGRIALQIEGGHWYFRNVYLKEVN